MNRNDYIDAIIIEVTKDKKFFVRDMFGEAPFFFNADKFKEMLKRDSYKLRYLHLIKDERRLYSLLINHKKQKPC